MPSPPVELEVFADVACPWCLVGHARLRRALGSFGPGAVRVRHRAFELRPDLPPEGEPAAELYARKFGSEQRAAATFARVEREARRDGLELRLGAIERAPNTRLAQRAVALAGEQGAELPALDALMRAYLCEGLDVGRAEVIVARLAAAGVSDPGAIAAGLAGDGGEASVEADTALAARLDVTAVPLFVADRGFGLPGAQPPELLERLLRHAERRRLGEGPASPRLARDARPA